MTTINAEHAEFAEIGLFCDLCGLSVSIHDNEY